MQLWAFMYDERTKTMNFVHPVISDTCGGPFQQNYSMDMKLGHRFPSRNETWTPSFAVNMPLHIHHGCPTSPTIHSNHLFHTYWLSIVLTC